MTDFQGSSSEDERLRRLLNDAVSDVDPRDTLDVIRSRTAASPFRAKRPWLLGAGTAIVATAATIAAVAVIGGSPGTTGAPDPGPAGSPDAASTAATSTEPSSPSGEPSPSGVTSDSASSPRVEMTVPVYFIGDTSRGPRLYREYRTFEATEEDRGTEAVSLAMDPAVDPDYRSGWPDGVKPRSVTSDGNVITVDLTAAGPVWERPEELSSEEASMAVQQLVYTAQGAMQDGRLPVQFLLEGQRTDTLFNIPVSEPVMHGALSDVLAQLWIESPGEGEAVTSPFTVSGEAEAFEATVQWELRQNGDQVDSGFTTAALCCTTAPYSFEVEAPPGEYTIVVHDTNPSDGEGFAPWRDTKTVTVVP